MQPMLMVTRKATIRAGTARRSAGSANRRRRYAGLAIACARPLIESERADALAGDGVRYGDLRAGDVIVATGHPAKSAGMKQLLLTRVARPSDGWSWTEETGAGSH